MATAPAAAPVTLHIVNNTDNNQCYVQTIVCIKGSNIYGNKPKTVFWVIYFLFEKCKTFIESFIKHNTLHMLENQGFQ